MKNCEACKKTLEGAKARIVDLEGRRTLLCGGCGRIEFLDEKGEKRGGLLQALGRAVRRSHGGRSITFHAEFPLVKGQVLREAAASALPAGTRPIPSRVEVIQVRPLVVVETMPAAGPDPAGKSRRPRHKRRTVGYSVRAIPL